ncbi:MAG: succinylglutamate desuccinylase/aspartoacylase family protein [Pirellulales bacterium]|nr:succinylglutamate desuccinylase/aspartoacylase family protein [Pirellulales bacterium]
MFAVLLIAAGSPVLAQVAAQTVATDAAAVATESPAWDVFTVLGVDVQPGTKHKLTSMELNDFVGMRMAVPVWIARGARPGKTLAVTAGIHGDEINGVEIARRLFVETDPDQLSGTLVVLPLLNRHGFLAGSRYMSDRRDLNRAFPGDPVGSSAGITAHSVFAPVILRSDALIDLHTASDTRVNLPQIRTKLASQPALELARAFGAGVVLNGAGPAGSLRRSALDAGIPAIIYEAGGVLVLELDEIERGLTGIRNIMRHLGMLAAAGDEPETATVYDKTLWLRVPPGAAGMFLTKRRPGDEVRRGDVLGVVVDPLSDQEASIVSPADGLIIGMEKPNVVYTGDALFHLGLEKLAK